MAAVYIVLETELVDTKHAVFRAGNKCWELACRDLGESAPNQGPGVTAGTTGGVVGVGHLETGLYIRIYQSSLPPRGPGQGPAAPPVHLLLWHWSAGLYCRLLHCLAGPEAAATWSGRLEDSQEEEAMPSLVWRSKG